MQRERTTKEDGLYVAGACALAAIIVLLLLKYKVFPDFNILTAMRPCIWHTLTGYFCPGCGGTRSVVALVHGRFLVCAVNYPLVAYTVLMYAWFMISQTIERLSRGRFAVGMKWRSCYLWIAMGILAAHFVGKNVFFMLTGIQPFLR